MKKIDLQIHSTASDGKFSPSDVVDMAVERGMEAIAITDHDTVSGLDEASIRAKERGLELVSGVEISCSISELNCVVDVLGLFIDYKNEELRKVLDGVKKDRVEEKKEIVKKLNELGYEITFNELLKEAKDSLGRPHIAKILARKYPEKFKDINDAFDKLIGNGKPAFIERPRISIKKTIDIIKKAGGISILAHPGRYFNEDDKIIEKFISAGGKGIEVNYPYDKILKIDKDLNPKYRKIAEEKGLLMSGGSDFHRKDRGSEIGDGGLERDEFEKLKSNVA